MKLCSYTYVSQRRDTAAALEQRMSVEGHKVAQLSGALEGPERDIIIDKFRRGEAKVLITTNVLARGIDVQSVTMVINYVCIRTFSHPDFSLCFAGYSRDGEWRP